MAGLYGTLLGLWRTYAGALDIQRAHTFMATARIAHAALHVGLVTALLLLVPGVAMQFTTEVAWGHGDFVAAAALIFGACMTFLLGSRRAKTARQRVAVGLLVLGALAIIWAELAVGVFH